MKLRYWIASLAFIVAIPVSLIHAAPPAGAQTERCSNEDPATTVPPTPGSGSVDDMESGSCSGLMETVVGSDNPGPYPTSHYDIGYDQGGNCVCMSRRYIGAITDGAFAVNRWFVSVGLGIVKWALAFHIADLLQTAALNIAARYETNIIGPLGLGHLFLLITVLWGGLLAFTGRLGRGISEVGISLLIGAVGATILANPATSLMGMLHFTEGMSFDLAAVSAGQPTGSATQNSVGTTMISAIHHAFVERPHEIISWGRPIPAGDSCRAIYEQDVATGPWSTSSKPRVAMKEAGCKAEDKFNRDPSWERFGVALLTTVAGALVMILLVMVSLTLIAAQFGVLLAIITAPFGFLFGLLPGRGRTLFWRWVASAGMALIGVLMMAVLLSLTLVTVELVLSNTIDAPLMIQMGMVDLVVVMALWKRKRLLEGGRRATANFAQRMSGSGGARSGSWVRSAGMGIAGGAGAAAGFSWARSELRHHGHVQRQKRTIAATEARGEAAGANADYMRQMAETMQDQFRQSHDYQTESLEHSAETRDNSRRTAEGLDELVNAFDDARA